MPNPSGRIVALDIGTKRIGVASASTIARLPSALPTLSVTDTIFADIRRVLADEEAIALVVGLPRGLEGQETQQTQAVQSFVHMLEPHVSVPVYWQDEALTSVLSEEALRAKKGTYQKGDVDAQAAVRILEDFLATHKELSHV